MFLVSEATMGQRLLRAKKRVERAGIPYQVPEEADLPERLDGVLAVVYLVFTQGYAGAAAPGLAEEAIRLGRLLVEVPGAGDRHTQRLAGPVERGLAERAPHHVVRRALRSRSHGGQPTVRREH